MDSNAEKTQLEDLSSAEPGAVSSFDELGIDTTTPEETSQETSTANSDTNDEISNQLHPLEIISNDGNLEYVSEEAETFLKNFRSCVNTFDTDIRNLIVKGYTDFQNLNEKTKEKLVAKQLSADNLFFNLQFSFNARIDQFESIIDNTELLKRSMEEIDNGSGGASTSNIPTVSYDPVAPDSDGNNKPNIDIEVPDIGNEPGTDTEQPDIDNDFNDSIIMFGTLVLTEAVTMYETIGGVGTQASIDGNYSVLEIVKDGDNYYYKIIDNATGKVYYVPVNNQVQFATEYEKIVEIKENAMLLNSTEIGSDNFVKLADPNKIYFVQGETESNGITFYEVVEDGTGETYYIPFSDSMEVTSLDSIGSTTIEPTISTDTNVSNGLNTSGEPSVSVESGMQSSRSSSGEPAVSAESGMQSGAHSSGEPAVSAESGTTIIHEEGI